MAMRIERQRGRIDRGGVAALLLCAALLTAWMATSGEPAPTAPASPAETVAPVASIASAVPVAPVAPVAGPASGVASAPTRMADAMPAPAPVAEPPAHWSLADARTAGDDRAPPLQRAAPEAPAPTWELDDHRAYARREQAQHQAVQRAFVAAADRELPLIEQQIARGRALGLSAEQLAKGEEKLRRIAAMRAEMQAALAASAAGP